MAGRLPPVAQEDQPTSWRAPTRVSSIVFRLKAVCLRLWRAASDLGSGPRRHATGDCAAFPQIGGRSTSPLWSDLPAPEQAYQEGKIRNLEVAARALDGVVVPAGEVFSFWRHVGRPGADRGFVVGRMLQQGCLVPSVGGGLCQLSNGLYDAALQAGCDIVERHAHSRVVPGSAAALGRDATVAWNYVDLRFRSDVAMRIEARVDGEALVVALAMAEGAAPRHRPPISPDSHALTPPVARSCATCGELGCFRHEASAGSPEG
jgi:hypothetical protein